MNSPPKRPFLSLGLKLTAPVVLLVLATALLIYWGLVRQERAALLHSKEVAADMVVKLTAVSMAPAVDFSDQGEIDREVASLALNPEVTDVEFWAASEDGKQKKPAASFHRGPAGRLDGVGKQAGQRVVSEDAVYLTQSVTNPEGKSLGVLAVRFSTDREAAELRRLARQSLWVALIASLALAGAILLTISRVAIGPLRRLQQAAVRLSRGEPRGAELTDQRAGMDDEVRQLAATFAEMAAAVTDREDKLAARNTDLKLILDSVQQGFLTANRDGSLRPQRSAIVDSWLPDLPADLTFFDLVERINPRTRPWAEAAWEQITDGQLPMEVALDQLPQQLVGAGRHLALEYHPVIRDGALVQLGIVVSDVTAEIERERAAAEQREFSVLVDQFVRDRRAFTDFWTEATQLVDRILDPNACADTGLKRDLHTLKGSARFYGLARLASLMHDLEDALGERMGDVLVDEERSRVGELWRALVRRIEPLTRGATTFVDITEEEYDRLVQAIVARKPHPALEKLVRELKFEPTERRLERAKEVVLEACQKLGKGAPEVRIDHHDIRLPAGPWAPLWTVLPHILRNAADHGIEPAAEREACGKPSNATVVLSTSVDGADLVVKVEDDGRGIDWDRVRELAAAHHLPHQSPADLHAALLHEGLSTRRTTTEVSGRGVGLAAVHGVVEALNGSVELDSQPGKGTAWTFRFPLGSARG
jgi:two-component system, chemotaxis family, sensor kinase CheA